MKSICKYEIKVQCLLYCTRKIIFVCLVIVHRLYWAQILFVVTEQFWSQESLPQYNMSTIQCVWTDVYILSSSIWRYSIKQSGSMKIMNQYCIFLLWFMSSEVENSWLWLCLYHSVLMCLLEPLFWPPCLTLTLFSPHLHTAVPSSVCHTCKYTFFYFLLIFSFSLSLSVCLYLSWSFNFTTTHTVYMSISYILH